jgi:putative membrane protein
VLYECVRFLDEGARKGFKRAVETVENASAVEVVIAVRHASASYRHANAIVGGLVAFGALAVMLFAPRGFSLPAILVDPFIAGLLAAWLVEILPIAKRGLTPRSWRRAHVTRAARATFVERGVHATTGRSGLLVYISWLEHEVALVPDLGLARDVADGVLAKAELALSAAMPHGARVAAGVEALAQAMATAMPHQADDVNELPDAIDSDE